MEDLEVLEVSVFGVDVELDTRHWDVEVDRVEDLTKSRSATLLVLKLHPISIYDASGLCHSHVTCISCAVAGDVVVRHGKGTDGGVLRGVVCNIPSSALLNLSDIQLQQAVKPCQELLSIVIVSVYLLMVNHQARSSCEAYLDSPILSVFCKQLFFSMVLSRCVLCAVVRVAITKVAEVVSVS